MKELDGILDKASKHGEALSSELLPLVYDELRHLAAVRLSQQAAATLQPTELVHEAWIKLKGSNDRSWNDRAHFFRSAALAMRSILVDRARRKASLKRGEGKPTLDLDEIAIAGITPDERVLMVDEALQVLEREHPESARMIILKFFGGLTNDEIASSEGINERTVRRRWNFAKARLYHLLRDSSSGEA